MAQTKAVKITDVRGYTPRESDRTLFGGSVYRLPEKVADEVIESGRGRAAKGGEASAAVPVGVEVGEAVAAGGPGGSSYTADPEPRAQGQAKESTSGKEAGK